MTSFLTARPPRLRPQGVTGRHLRAPRGSGPRQDEGGLRRHGIYRRSEPDYPLVSVITVCFNAADTLAETVASVRAQTYPNIEYIIIDGASTDGTLDVIRRHQRRIDYYISEPDDGLYDAMNRGLALAHGAYVMILNADDAYDPELIELLLRAQVASGADVVGAMVAAHDLEGRYMRPHGRLPYDLTLYHWMTLWLETLLVPTAVYDAIGPFDLRYPVIADTDFGLRLLHGGFTVYELARALKKFRAGGASSDVTAMSHDYKRLLRNFFPDIDTATIDKVADLKNFSRDVFDAAIRDNADQPLFVESLIARGFTKRNGYAFERPAPAVVKRDIRLSVVLDDGGGRPLSATDLSPYLDLAENDVTVEVICTLDDTAPDDGLRAAAAEEERIVLLRAPLALTRGARLNRVVARMRGDFVYFADPAAPPVAGGLARLVAEGDRSYGNIIRARAQDAPGDDGPPENKNHYNFLVQNLPSLLDRSDWRGQAIFRWRLARNCRFPETLDGDIDRHFVILATLTAVRVCWLTVPIFTARAGYETSVPAPDAAAMLDRIEVADRAWTLLSDAGFEDQAASFLATQELVPTRAQRRAVGTLAAAKIARRLAAFERKQAAPLSTAADRPGDLSPGARPSTQSL